MLFAGMILFFTPKCVIRLTGKQLILLLFKNWILAWMIRDTDYTDLPLILILSVYIYIYIYIYIYRFFTLRILQNTFLPQNLAKYRFFQECETFFFTFSLVIQIFSIEYWFSLSFILILCSTRVAGLIILQKQVFFFNLSQLSDVTDTLNCCPIISLPFFLHILLDWWLPSRTVVSCLSTCSKYHAGKEPFFKELPPLILILSVGRGGGGVA